MSTGYRVRAGFVPLLDSALLVAAREKGFAEEEGIELVLMREHSWASIRDRLAVGHFDVAHVLAPMPIAFNLGLSPLAARTLVPMALGLGGNAVTVSTVLWGAMREQGAAADFDPVSTGAALRHVLARRAKVGASPARFAVVHPHSGHNYELRYWLAACGIDPDRDMEIVVVPPPLMASALASGQIDGYCAGEPWNTAAITQGVGRIVTVKASIWKFSPEKVLGVAASWAEASPLALAALLRALYRAAQWCGTPANHEELARLLAGHSYVDCPDEWLLSALCGRIDAGDGEKLVVPDFFVPHAHAATFPWKSHALWFYSQMVRWGHVKAGDANIVTARETYRPDLYRAALEMLGVALPSADVKIEGARNTAARGDLEGANFGLDAEGFFDGKAFDPSDIDGSLRHSGR